MFAVTTRNRLRSPLFTIPMLRARRYVAEQLQAMPGLIRYASAMAGPLDFYTLTIWETRRAMQRFMGSGAHERFLWRFTRWSQEFWSMRWNPEPGVNCGEIGDWDGASMRAILASGKLPPDKAWPSVPPLQLLSRQQTAGPGRRYVDPGQSGVILVSAVVDGGRITDYLRTLGAARSARSRSTHSPLRSVVGVTSVNQCLVLTLWDKLDEREDLLQALHSKLGARWVMRWEPGEYEIGRWGDLRLRQLAQARRKESGAEVHLEYAREEVRQQ